MTGNPSFPIWYDIAWWSIAIVAVGLVLWAIWSLATTKVVPASERALWLLLVLFFPGVGAVVWLGLRRSRVRASTDSDSLGMRTSHQT
jgi:hypothetical protein